MLEFKASELYPFIFYIKSRWPFLGFIFCLIWYVTCFVCLYVYFSVFFSFFSFTCFLHIFLFLLMFKCLCSFFIFTFSILYIFTHCQLKEYFYLKRKTKKYIILLVKYDTWNTDNFRNIFVKRKMICVIIHPVSLLVCCIANFVQLLSLNYLWL